MTRTLIDYARGSSDKQDLTAQHDGLVVLGVAEKRIHLDHGLTGTNRRRPWLDHALVVVRDGDTLVVPKLDRLARSVPDARAIGDRPGAAASKLSLGGQVYNILATFAEFEVDLLRMRNQRTEGRRSGQRPTARGKNPSCIKAADRTPRHARRQRLLHHRPRRTIHHRPRRGISHPATSLDTREDKITRTLLCGSGQLREFRPTSFGTRRSHRWKLNLASYGSCMNPLASAQRLRRWSSTGRPSDFRGTGFLYRWQNRVLTARHCISGIPPEEIAVEAGFAIGFTQSVIRLHEHPTADIAILEIGGLQFGTAQSEPFHRIEPATSLGVDFMAYGYPVDMDGGVPNVPAPRLLKGHFQRYVPEYRSHEGYMYRGGETSISMPAGVSGGPLFSPTDHAAVIAMATGSIESERLRHATEEVLVDGAPKIQTVYRTVVTYGIALMLSDVTEWLDDLCPPRDSYDAPASIVLPFESG